MAMYLPDLINLNPADSNSLTSRGITNKGLNTSTFGGWGSYGLLHGSGNVYRFITEPGKQIFLITAMLHQQLILDHLVSMLSIIFHQKD